MLEKRLGLGTSIKGDSGCTGHHHATPRDPRHTPTLKHKGYEVPNLAIVRHFGLFFLFSEAFFPGRVATDKKGLAPSTLACPMGLLVGVSGDAVRGRVKGQPDRGVS